MRADGSKPAGADIHNHLMPGVDDGAADLEEARAALEVLAGQGVTLVVTTPHVQGSRTLRPESLERRLGELDAAWARLRDMAASEFPDMVLGRGTEVMMDVPRPALDDERLRIVGGDYVLVEFPYMTVPPEAARALADMRLSGLRPVLAHPERYAGLDRELEGAGEWRRAGALLQVNAGSVTGRYGDDARRAALRLLERGWVDLLASDYHARGSVGIGSARDWLLEQGAEEHAVLLMAVNPRRIVEGQDPEPVPPLERRPGFWARLAAAFR